MKAVALNIATVVMFTAGVGPARSQDLRVGIIDFYRLRQVPESQVRGALSIREDDTIDPKAIDEAKLRLAELPGVERVRIGVVCCDNGRAILYVGLEQKGSPVLRFRAAPRGRIRLPADVIQLEDEFSRAGLQAVLLGNAGEDHSKGHALMYDPDARAVQEQFINYAVSNVRLLRQVLRDSDDEQHRALAAQILGYAPDKRAVVDDLARAMDDPSESVRNNVMRALAVMADFSSRSPELKIRIPARRFVNLLNSPVWSDLNKASMALAALSETRDKGLLKALREHAIESLVDMARFKSEGHAWAAFLLLGRVAGLPEDEIQAAWTRGDREDVIRLALNRR